MRAKLRSLEETHALRLADVFAHAPVGVAMLKGPEHVFEFANQRYLELIGGRPVLEANPSARRCPSWRARGSTSCWTTSTRPASRTSAGRVRVC